MSGLRPLGQIQSRRSDGQLETSWPSAARIQIEYLVNRFDPWPTQVATNDDVDPARDWIELQFVQDIDAAPTEPYPLGLRTMFRPVAVSTFPLIA
jgi:hypothetical protein